MEMRCQGFFDSAMVVSSQLRNHNTRKPMDLGSNVFSKKLDFGGASSDCDDLEDWNFRSSFASKGHDSPRPTKLTKGSLADLSKLQSPKGRKSAQPGSPGRSSGHHSMPEEESENSSVHSAASRRASNKLWKGIGHQKSWTDTQKNTFSMEDFGKTRYSHHHSSGFGKLPPRANVFHGDEVNEENEDDISLRLEPVSRHQKRIYPEDEEPLNEEQLENDIARLKEECFLYGQWLQEFDPTFMQTPACNRRRL